MARGTDVPRWLYFVGAAAIFLMLAYAPGVLDGVSDRGSDVMIDGIENMQSTTTTSTTTTSVP
jgi:hypothetical protein